MSDARSKPPRRVWLAGAVAVLALAAAAIGVASFERASAPAAAASPVDMRGDPVRLEPGAAPSAAVVERMKVTSSSGERLAVPSVGLDVPLGSLTAVDGTITPPGFTSAYQVRNLGTTASAPAAGTVYVVAHSIRGGGVAPGNYLADVRTQQSRVKVGALVEVAGVRYVVTASETIAKTALPTSSAVWANAPNRLVIITCLENADGAPSTQNLVLVATRQP